MIRKFLLKLSIKFFYLMFEWDMYVKDSHFKNNAKIKDMACFLLSRMKYTYKLKEVQKYWPYKNEK